VRPGRARIASGRWVTSRPALAWTPPGGLWFCWLAGLGENRGRHHRRCRPRRFLFASSSSSQGTGGASTSRRRVGHERFDSDPVHQLLVEPALVRPFQRGIRTQQIQPLGSCLKLDSVGHRYEFNFVPFISGHNYPVF
jgi:hypothetical protein